MDWADVPPHRKMHSLVPVYKILYDIERLAQDGIRNGKGDVFIDIRGKAVDGMAELSKLEKELANDLQKV